MFDEEDEEMEMPTPCKQCGEWFDLNDGYGSEKWHPNTVICYDCFKEEEKELEEDEYWDELNIEVANALHGLDEKNNLKERLTKDNIKLIKKISTLL